MVKHIKQSTAFWAAFWDGITAPGITHRRIRRIPMPTMTATEALRSDWVKIGGDFNRVISREQAKESRA
jgi:hypothetical protein